MQYNIGLKFEIIWFRQYLKNAENWRTWKIRNSTLMQYNMGLKFGVIWARQFLLKASKAKLEVSTATWRG